MNRQLIVTQQASSKAGTRIGSLVPSPETFRPLTAASLSPGIFLRATVVQS